MSVRVCASSAEFMTLGWKIMPSTRPDSPARDHGALALERALGLLEEHPVAAAFAPRRDTTRASSAK